jgi:hypothetical protein
MASASARRSISSPACSLGRRGLLRRLGLEWLHRLYREPRRLARRYLLEDPAILGIFLAERRRARGG